MFNMAELIIDYVFDTHPIAHSQKFHPKIAATAIVNPIMLHRNDTECQNNGGC